MKKSRSLTLKLGAALAAVLLVSSCSAEGESEGGEETFIVAVGTNPAQLNAGITTDNTTKYIGHAVFEELVTYTEDFTIVPRLATSWEANDDSTMFTFNLREGATWHDGEPFTSEDVKFTFEEVLPLHPLGGALSNLVDRVETPDAQTTVLYLSAPYGPTIETMTSIVILPAHIYAGTDILTNEANMTPIGTGPFKIDAFNVGDSVLLSPYSDYWGESSEIDQLVFKVMPDTSARTLALQSGEVDFVPPSFFALAQKEIVDADERFESYLASSQPQQLVMFYNSEKGTLAEYNVRQALLRAIDREAIAAKVYLGTADPARGPIPNQFSWATDDSIDFVSQFAYDPEEAAELLDAAGFPADASGNRFSVTIDYIAGNPIYGAIAELIKSDLAEIGVDVNLSGDDVNVFIESVFTQATFDLAIIELAGYADPNLGVARAYVCNADDRPFQNANNICDAEIDEAWQQAGSVSDRDVRVDFFADAEERIAETLGTAPLVSAYQVGVINAEKWSGLEEFAQPSSWNWSALSAK